MTGVVLGTLGCASGEAAGPDAGLGSIFADAGRGIPGPEDAGPKAPADAAIPSVTPDAAVLPDAPPPPDAALGCTDQPVHLLANGNFDLGPTTSWVESSGGGYTLVTDELGAGHSGTWVAWLGGYDGGVDILYQDVAVPAGATELVVSGQMAIATSEGLFAWDVAALEVRTVTGAMLESLGEWSNEDDTEGVWQPFSIAPAGSYQGQTIRLYLRSQTDSSLVTSFWFDSLAVRATVCQ